MALQFSFRFQTDVNICSQDFPTKSEATSVIDKTKHLLRTNTVITFFALSVILYHSEVGHSWIVLGW